MAWQLTEYRLFEPEASTYKGATEVLYAELKGPPEQLLPVNLMEKIIIAFESKVTPYGGHPLRIKIWSDWSPTWYSLYKVELTIHASPLAWNIVIPAVAAVLIVIGLSFITWEVTHASWGSSLPSMLGDVKWIILAASAVAVLWLMKKKTPAISNPRRRPLR